jgi:hypothetical protein
MIDTIDVAMGRVEVDMCMARWREFYHSTVWSGLAADPRIAPSDGVTMCTYHAWFASDLPSHWKAPPCITVPGVSCSHLISLIKLRTSGNHKLAIQQLRQVYPIVRLEHPGLARCAVLAQYKTSATCCLPAQPFHLHACSTVYFLCLFLIGG